MKGKVTFSWEICIMYACYLAYPYQDQIWVKIKSLVSNTLWFHHSQFVWFSEVFTISMPSQYVGVYFLHKMFIKKLVSSTILDNIILWLFNHLFCLASLHQIKSYLCSDKFWNTKHKRIIHYTFLHIYLCFSLILVTQSNYWICCIIYTVIFKFGLLLKYVGPYFIFPDAAASYKLFFDQNNSTMQVVNWEFEPPIQKDQVPLSPIPMKWKLTQGIM